MEISKLQNICNLRPALAFGNIKKSEQKELKTDNSCLNCLESEGRMIASNEPKNMARRAEEFIQKTLVQNETIKKRTHVDTRKGKNIVYIQIGDPIEGFEGLYDDKKRAACYFDEKGKLTQGFVLNKNTNEVDVYDSNGKKTHHYNKDEMDALYYYKYHPDEIHRNLREERKLFSGSFEDEAKKTIQTLTEIFSDESKVFRTSEDKTLYRALQQRLTEEEMKTLSTLGSIYKDSSFCSTTTNLDVAKAFNSGNPILEINFPKNSKYVDIEGLFNIDRRHWMEDEFLLNRNSKFLITGFDSKNNIIKCDYIGE